MSAESVVYYLNRPSANDPGDATEWLLSAMAEFTEAELRELLYVGQEPEFFELMRGVFALSEETRLVLQKFLAANESEATTATIDHAGRCILSRGKTEQPTKILPKIVC